MAEDMTPASGERITMFTALKKFADFEGRATRKEFGLFLLLEVALLALILLIKAGITCTWPLFFEGYVPEYLGQILNILFFLVTLFLLAPGLAVAVRRLQDFGQHKKLVIPVAVWYFLFVLQTQNLFPLNFPWIDALFTFVNFFAGIYSLVLLWFLFFRKSDAGENQYGPAPLAEPEAEPCTLLEEVSLQDVEDVKVTVWETLLKFKQFTGRATRREFFLFVLATAAGAILLFLLNFLLMLGLFAIAPYMLDYVNPSNYFATLLNLPILIPFFLVSIAWNLGLLCPTVAVSIRRMHDTGRSGRFALLLAPYLFLTTIGIWLPTFLFPPVARIFVFLLAMGCGIAFLFFACMKSQPDRNQYDLDEEEEAEEEDGEAGEVEETEEADGAEENTVE